MRPEKCIKICYTVCMCTLYITLKGVKYQVLALRQGEK